MKGLERVRERRENEQIERVAPINEIIPLTASQLEETRGFLELHLFIWYHILSKMI